MPTVPDFNLWQRRFASFALDEEHLVHAVRHVALNPVRARLVERAADWPWSSVHAHLKGRDDAVMTMAPVLERAGDFAALLNAHADHPAFTALRRAATAGRSAAGPGPRTWKSAPGGRSSPQGEGQSQEIRGLVLCQNSNL